MHSTASDIHSEMDCLELLEGQVWDVFVERMIDSKVIAEC